MVQPIIELFLTINSTVLKRKTISTEIWKLKYEETNIHYLDCTHMCKDFEANLKQINKMQNSTWHVLFSSTNFKVSEFSVSKMNKQLKHSVNINSY